MQKSSCESLRKKDFISRNNFDVICLSETWLNDGISDDIISINNYKIYRNDRLNRPGGGVAVFVKDNFNVRVISNHLCINIEHLRLEVIINNTRLILAVVYRPPTQPLADFLNSFEEVMGYSIISSDNIICCGDFNVDFLKPNINSCVMFQNILDAMGLYQIMEQPTRISRTASTMLDLLITNSKEIILHCDVLNDVGINTNHSVVNVTAEVGKVTTDHKEFIRGRNLVGLT